MFIYQPISIFFVANFTSLRQGRKAFSSRKIHVKHFYRGSNQGVIIFVGA